MPQGLHIGRVASDTGLSVHAIRFYERLGILNPPPRSEGRFRVFGEDEVRDLKFIRRAHGLGLSLAEIRELLALRRTAPQACAQGREVLRRVLRRVDEKIRELTRLERQLHAALRICDRHARRSGDGKTCPVLREFDRGAYDRHGRLSHEAS